MSPRLTIRQKYPELFTADSSATPATLSLPESRGAVTELLTQLQRELMYARRTADAARIRAGMKPVYWTGAPRYAKLRHRPLVYGSSPMASARSGVPFDDATGDGLAKRWGLPGGYHQLLACAKLANLYPAPVADLPLAVKTDAVRRDLLDTQVQSGLFADRVVILVGKEAARVFGYDTTDLGDFAGPLDRRRVVGAREVLMMPDPAESVLWGTQRGQLRGRKVLLRALLAARLPVVRSERSIVVGIDPEGARRWAGALAPFDVDEFRENADVHMEASCVWVAMGGQPPGPLASGSVVPLWCELCRVGIAPPRDLGAGAWWFDSPTGTSTMYLDHGRAVVSGMRGKPKLCALLRQDGTTLQEVQRSDRATGLRWAEDAAAQLGWEHAFVALDKRLSALQGAA